jgi:hypothetical protein
MERILTHGCQPSNISTKLLNPPLIKKLEKNGIGEEDKNK